MFKRYAADSERQIRWKHKDKKYRRYDIKQLCVNAILKNSNRAYEINGYLLRGIHTLHFLYECVHTTTSYLFSSNEDPFSPLLHPYV